MDGLAFPPFPRASTPLKRQRAQSGEGAITRSLLVFLFVLFIVLAWGSVATAPASEQLAENGSATLKMDATRSQPALEKTLSPQEHQSSTPAATYLNSTLSNGAFSVATLPAMMLTSTVPGYFTTLAVPHTASNYAAPGTISLSPKLYPSYVVRRSSQGERGGNNTVGNAPPGREAAASLQPMTHLPTAAMLSLNPNVQIVSSDSQRSSAVLPSQLSLGNPGEGTFNPLDIRYSSTPMLGTMHTGVLPPHVSPALCWRQDKYGRYPSKPWYCSLICRLMARKVAEKEAAKHNTWANAPRRTSPKSAPSSGEWFDSKEFDRLTKAVLDASTRSPVVVFTKGHCRYCKDAIKLLQDVGVKQIYVVDLGRARDMLKLQLVLEKLTGARTVPRIYIGGVCVGGLSDMTKEHENGALKQRLEKASAL